MALHIIYIYIYGYCNHLNIYLILIIKFQLIHKHKQKEEMELAKIIGDYIPSNEEDTNSTDSDDEFYTLFETEEDMFLSISSSEDEASDIGPILSDWKEPHNMLLRVERCNIKLYTRLLEKVQNYTDQLPIVGFNSGKYDINLIFSKLIIRLQLNKADNPGIVKKGSAYYMISNGKFRFLDLSAYLAPGVSYSKFLAIYNIEELKSFFPYEFLDSADKLSYPRLPPKEAFYSTVKGCNTLGSTTEEINHNYSLLEHVWKEKTMSNLGCLLKFYNEVDVRPGKLAIINMKQFYRDRQIDLFKDAISIAGIARKLLFRHANTNGAQFYSFCQKEKDLYKKFKTAITGGVSIVYSRYSKKGETFIRNNPKVPSDSILSLDCNTLYLFCLAQDSVPVGRLIRRECANQFKAECRYEQFSAMDWLDYISERDSIPIQHKYNKGEKRIGPFLLGFILILSIHVI